MYAPKPIFSPTLEELTRIVEEELNQIATEVAQFDFQHFTILHVEPAKRFAGLVVYADGTDWNPGGTGEGIYRYSIAGAWVKVG